MSDIFDSIAPEKGDIFDSISMAESPSLLSRASALNKEAGAGIIRNLQGISGTIGAGMETALGAGTGALAFPASMLTDFMHTFDKNPTGHEGEKIAQALSYQPQDPRARGALEKAFYPIEVGMGMASDAADLISESRGVPKDSGERRRGQIALQAVGMLLQGKAVKSIKGEVTRQTDIIRDKNKKPVELAPEAKPDIFDTVSESPKDIFDEVMPKAQEIRKEQEAPLSEVKPRPVDDILADLDMLEPEPTKAKAEPQAKPEIVEPAATSQGKVDVKPEVQKALQEPTPIPIKEAITTKAQTKQTLEAGLGSGDISVNTPVRLTTVDELRSIIKNENLFVGKDAEGYDVISAQKINSDTPIVGYGANNKVSAAIIFDGKHVESKGMAPNEVSINPKTSVQDLRFVIDGHGKILTFEELKNIYKEKPAKSEPVKPMSPELPPPDADLQPHRTAQRVEAEAISKELLNREGLGEDIAKYEVEKGMMDTQAQLGVEIMNRDWNSAVKMALGEISAPEGVRPGTMITAVSKRAMEKGDYETIYQLGTNEKSYTVAQEVAKDLKSFDQGLSDSPVTAIRSVVKARKEENAKTGVKPDQQRQQAEIDKLKTLLDETQKKFDEYIAKTETKSTKYGSSNKIVTTDAYLKAKQELRERLAGISANPFTDPVLMADLGKIGAYHLEAGARSFAVWSSKVVADVGDSVKPHLEDLWKQAGETVGDKNRNIKAKINKALENGKDFSEIGVQIQAIAKGFIQDGIKDRNKLVDGIHAEIKELIPDITAREIADAISGYGKYKLLSKDEVSAQLRDIKGQLQQVSKLEDLENRRPPLKTGIERRIPSDTERTLIKQVDEAKKKYGIEAVDSETQLKSSLDAVKTRLKNQIADLEKQISDKKKIVSEKTNLQYDSEANQLKTKRDELKTAFDAIFGKPELTVEQRVNIAKKAVEKSITEYAEKIANKDISPMGKKSQPVTTPELETLRTERAILQAEWKVLRDAANPKLTPEQRSLKSLKTRLTNEAKKLTEKLQSFDFEPVEKRTTVLDAEGRRLKDIRDRTKLAYDTAVRKTGSVTHEEAKTLMDLAKNAAELKSKHDPNVTTNHGWPSAKDRLEYGKAQVAFERYVAELKEGDTSLKAMAKRRIAEFQTTAKENPVKAAKDLALDTLGEISDSSIALVASMDNSFIGRQGLVTLQTHPTVWAKAAAKSFSDIYKALRDKHGNEVAKDILHADLVSRENYINGNYQKSGILAKFEEQYPTSHPSRVPVIGRAFKASEVAFTNTALRMRLGTFDLLLDMANKADIPITKALVEDIGSVVNSATARAKTHDSKLIKNLLWAPKMMLANVNILTAHGLTANLQTSFARKQAAYNLMKIAGETAAVVAVLNALKPDSVETDPRSSDFMKYRDGNTRIDLTAGRGQYITLASRWLTGQTKNAQTKIIKDLNLGGFGQNTYFDVGMNFLINKATPTVRQAVYFSKGKNFEGKKPTIGTALADLTIPIPIKNIADDSFGDYSEDKAIALIGNLADVFGINANTYIQLDRWDNKSSKEIVAFRNRVGEERFKEANIRYNKKINDIISNVVKNERYLALPEEEKQKYITRIKRIEKDRILKGN